jgi:isocitrate dehydrogenase kinase/phosphatase
MDLPSLASIVARGADTIHWAFDEHHQRLRGITRRVRQRFERRDWAGIRQDTVERLDLDPRSVGRTCDGLREQLGPRFADREAWAALKGAYGRAIVGRDDFELAQTFFNSLVRRVFPELGADPALTFLGDDVPLPYRGWEMASARLYAVREVDGPVVRKVLEDAGLRAPFRDLGGDAELAAERIRAGVAAAFGDPGIEALDVLRPVFFRNKGAYLIGRARRDGRVLPVILALVHGAEGLAVDAVLPTEDEASVVFSFARWYFHAEVDSPREVIGFLSSILPRKRTPELYISLGYAKHGKTEFYRDLTRHIAGSDDLFVAARGQRGLVMSVFTLPSYPFVFKLIKDRFPPPKSVTPDGVRARYREVLVQDRVGRLVDFQEFEHLSFPRARFADDLLAELLRESGRTVEVQANEVIVRHAYVQRRVTPLDVYLSEAALPAASETALPAASETALPAASEAAGTAASEAAALDWGRCLKDLAAANIFPGDILLKNFGVTRHGRVVSYDYDELTQLTACRFREMPEPRDELEEMAAEPWFTVAEGDVFPRELRTFLGLRGAAREAFLARHSDLFGTAFWRALQDSHRRGEVVDFYPYAEHRRLRPAGLAPQPEPEAVQAAG